MSTTYLNTAATGIVSTNTLKAASKYDAVFKKNPAQAFFSFLENDYEIIKQEVAAFVGVGVDRFSFVPNFSYGFSSVLNSMKGQVKRVLTFQSDYPSLTLPLELQGYEVRKLKSKNMFSWDLDEIEAAINKYKPHLIAISHVQYLSGFKINLKELSSICRKNNVLLLVDATQSLGAMPFNFDESEIDVLIASNYKWMNAGFGSGLVCFKEGFLEQFPPTLAGYGSLKPVNGKMTYKPTASSYFPGHMDYKSLIMLGHAVNEKSKLDLRAVEEHNMGLIEQFVEAANGVGIDLVGWHSMENRSAIVVFHASKELNTHLKKCGIQFTFRNDTIRVSFHYTNKKEDVNTLLTALNDFKT